nr:MAG TPA: hypothetical protein [Caudoviricetes sp.]
MLLLLSFGLVVMSFTVVRIHPCPPYKTLKLLIFQGFYFLSLSTLCPLLILNKILIV